MKTKSFNANVKAVGTADGLGDGQFTALVAVFGNKDHGGDVIVPGAFAESLRDWAASGDAIPAIWSHQWSDPFAHIGWSLSAAETADGLLVTAQLDLENPTALQTYKLLKQRRVKEFSFGYDVVDGGYVTQDEDEFFELRKLNLIEFGPTLKGMNPDTQLLGTKSDEDIRRIVREELAADPREVEPTPNVEVPPDPTESSGAPPESSPPQDGEPSGPSKSAGLTHAQVAAWATAAELILMEER
ncbi:HK97 family phage prohead protease [Curtobacterium sp. MCSS17_006]|uniref:HK97 family phage prohead protease n=1 Tax=unclassified Curtobacterium TaxID=257496 RepID=UPI000D8CF37E|nr:MULTISPECIES: HK97 family phage prohead protease [unclassified Curtobacterium]PYY60004.1 HK97 family phage prohead protease [Curtobacterium sp. MCSS17_011]PZE34005.1 HK97 family phage prohead protease [Curtobacterium sp. MCSS17_006]